MLACRSNLKHVDRLLCNIRNHPLGCFNCLVYTRWLGTHTCLEPATLHQAEERQLKCHAVRQAHSLPKCPVESATEHILKHQQAQIRVGPMASQLTPFSVPIPTKVAACCVLSMSLSKHTPAV